MQLVQAPEGYRMPRAAADLIEHARAHGWAVRSAWAADSGGAPYVTVALGRLLTGPEITMWRGNRWEYQVTWHNRGLAPGRLRLFGGWAITPGSPAAHNLPSVKAIQEEITAHPAPSVSADAA